MKQKRSDVPVLVLLALLMCCGQVSAHDKSERYYNDLNDFILHEGKGFTTMSSFYSSGSQWCSHPYVRVVVEYDNKAVRQSVLTSNPATYLQQTIIPEIKKICPKFPHAALYNKQVIDFRFRPKQGGIADERINPDRLGFNIDDQGQVKLTKDLAYRNWKDANKGSYAFEQENHNNTNRSLITGVETLMKAVKVAIQKIEKPLQTALQRREDYKQFFANTANPIFFEALNLNEDAIAYFNSALTEYKQAFTSLKNAHSHYSDPSGSKSSLAKAAQCMEDFKQFRQQAKSFEEMAWEKALQGDKKVKEGYQEVMKQKEQQ